MGTKVTVSMAPTAQYMGAVAIRPTTSAPQSGAAPKMAATVRQDTEGHTGISVRAVPGWDAAAVCEKFGGGGHKGAAGASLQNVTLEEAVEALKEAIQKRN